MPDLPTADEMRKAIAELAQQEKELKELKEKVERQKKQADVRAKEIDDL